ncbi:hypothetical protein L484_000083 [Morus notabilis]|uniref:Uncharacterized protein n=1 Tax=Morus notabilis TaxID=981085 RepID=W9T215_9ROSA|nr:hypothetical protein L484_000083 [Morus notabilis]
MRRSKVNLFDRRTIMDSATSTSDSDFFFAFNDSNFSDRILRIEIIPDLPETKSDGEGCTSLADWTGRRKRRREEIKRENGLVEESLNFALLLLVYC